MFASTRQIATAVSTTRQAAWKYFALEAPLPWSARFGVSPARLDIGRSSNDPEGVDAIAEESPTAWPEHLHRHLDEVMPDSSASVPDSFGLFRPVGSGSALLVAALGIAWQIVVGDRLPRRGVAHELADARSDAWIPVEGAHADPDRVGVREITSEQR
jgi:hypothetical protein